MEESKIIPENINLFHLNIVESRIADTAHTKDAVYKVSVAHSTMHNLEDERVKISLLIDIKNESEVSNNSANAHFNIDFHFKIIDLKNFYVLQENNSPLFSGLLIATLLGISFSTARGLIYERLSTTNLSGIILPVVSPSKLLESKINPTI